MTNSDRVTVQYDMVMAEKKKVRKQNKKAKETDVPGDRYIAFATNAPWMDVEEYSKRWGIETGYRVVENARAKTSSSGRPARLFCFLYSLVLFNAWVLVNAQLACFLQLRGTALPITQLYLKIAALITIYQKNKIPPEPPPNPVAVSTSGFTGACVIPGCRIIPSRAARPVAQSGPGRHGRALEQSW